MRFLDTNTFLRVLTGDDPVKAAACGEVFRRVGRGEEEAVTCEAVVAEVVFVLSSPRQDNLPHAEVTARLIPLLEARGLILDHKAMYVRALNLYVTYPAIDFEDVLNVAHMERLGLTELLGYDTDFDGIPGVERVEP